MSRKNIPLGAVATAALEQFAAVLRIGREVKGLTIQELADRLGVSRPTATKMLGGAAEVSIGTYFEAAYVLDVPLFDPDPDRVASLRDKTKQLEALLPQRVRRTVEEIDDDF